MDPNALTAHGLALAAYFGGETAARLIIRRDGRFEAVRPVSYFFRSPEEFSSIENEAMERCAGRVLDIGAGTGLHSLALRSRGVSVASLDICPHAVAIMAARGLADVHAADIFDFRGGPFDTLLMLGHGIGIVEAYDGLARFLSHAGRLTRGGGRLLIDSVDVRRTNDPRHLEYHERNRRAGRYHGETRIQFEYDGQAGAYGRWLHVDAETLRELASQAGWQCEVILEAERGEYLAGLTRPS